jgi:Urocanase Rossmann-like domain
MPGRAEDLQTEVLRAYTVLSSIRPDWAGALILNLGLNPAGAAVSLAANIAGAVCLSLESDAVLLRGALRSGSCDFIVNTLDEALRAMKNEVRKGRPLSVGLEGDPNKVLAEIIDRGVAPELFTAPASHPDAAAYFHSLGGLSVSFEGSDAHCWQLRIFTFPTSAELRAFDAVALSLIPEEDRIRRQWLSSVARILPRERHRALWLSDQETLTLHARFSASA